ncbi:hypothetical protein BDZ85DRAFT_318990 [Elsinoe ampelina]|uniref:Nephrocystin 3-like N-terminal domain-containing protein n=1 Tax=Elsinoe ampelina TaxID=302913 RepID=A0A6A6GDJ0_9PEZI|nr:hypothetical protein BDZ85DRAFT_318990 [Elsinoe ampelina]
MMRSFPKIKLGIVCGIGGGNPSIKHDIRLGDIVVGMPDGGFGGVVQYNAGKATPNGLSNAPAHNRPPHFVQQAVKNRITDMIEGMMWQDCMPKGKPEWTSMDTLDDVLHEVDGPNPRPKDRGSKIFYGAIASGDLVVKSSGSRRELVQQIARDEDDILAFEMEGAGIISKFPCLVVRGISDYCDEHKNDLWQRYASTVAAAYCKFVLQIIPPANVTIAPRAAVVAEATEDRSSRTQRSYQRSASNSSARRRSKASSQYALTRSARTAKVLQLAGMDDFVASSFIARFWMYNYRHDFLVTSRQRSRGTLDWLRQDSDFLWWRSTARSTMLCMTGEIGTGKSVLMTYVRTILQQDITSRAGMRTIFTVYSLSSSDNRHADTAIAIAIHQVLTTYTDLVEKAYKYDRENITRAPEQSISRFQPVTGRTNSRSIIALWGLFMFLVSEMPCINVAFLIDGFDHWSVSDQETFLHLAYSSLVGSSKLKIILSMNTKAVEKVTKRRIPQWASQYPDHFRCKDLAGSEDNFKSDIDLFIEDKAEVIAKRHHLSPDDKALVIAAMGKDNIGIFLPVVLRIEHLLQSTTANSDVISQLDSLPESLQQIYQSLLVGLGKSRSTIKGPLLLYLMYGQSPLRIVDLAFILHLREVGFAGTSQIEGKFARNTLCTIQNEIASLAPAVRYRIDENVVESAHPSFQQFLLNIARQSSGFGLETSKEAHHRIAEDCIQILVDNKGYEYSLPYYDAAKARDLSQAMETRPMIVYAFRYWSYHVDQATKHSSDCDQRLLDAVKSLLEVWTTAGESFRAQILIFSGNSSLYQPGHNRRPTVLELLSVLGLSVILAKLLPKMLEQGGFSPNVVASALSLAIRRGHKAVLDQLVDSLHITSLDDHVFDTALEDSTWTSQPELLAQVMSLRQPRLQELVKGLMSAFTLGDRNALRVITDNRALFRERTAHGRHALHLLVIEIAELKDHAPKQALAEAVYLVKQGIDINAPDQFGFTALHYACWGRYSSSRLFISGLIMHGANPFATTKGGLIPLHFAVRFSWEPEAIEMLLSCSPAITQALSNGRNSVLHWAAGRQLAEEPVGYKRAPWQIIALIIHHGGDPYAVNKSGVTPLLLAGPIAADFCKKAYHDLEGLQNSGFWPQDQDSAETFAQMARQNLSVTMERWPYILRRHSWQPSEDRRIVELAEDTAEDGYDRTTQTQMSNGLRQMLRTMVAGLVSYIIAKLQEKMKAIYG